MRGKENIHLLVRMKLPIPCQQQLEAVGAAALAEQIGAVAKTLHYLAGKGEVDPLCARHHMLGTQAKGDLAARLESLGEDGQGELLLAGYPDPDLLRAPGQYAGWQEVHLG